MIDYSYLRRGVVGMANAHRASSMAGHLGAALVAGYFFSEDFPNLEQEVYRGVEGELDRIEKGEEAFWYNQKAKQLPISDLFAEDGFFDSNPEPNASEILLDALKQTINKLRSSGHDIIFAMLALRAVESHEELATKSIVNGLAKLTTSFTKTGPGRAFFGEETGWKEGPAIIQSLKEPAPKYNTVGQMCEVLLSDMIKSGESHRQGFGGMWHLLDHAAAIVELERRDEQELVQQALKNHRLHLQLWRSLPDLQEELGPLKKAAASPWTPEFWELKEIRRDSARLSHRIKSMYGFGQILSQIEDEQLKADSQQAVLHFMA